MEAYSMDLRKRVLAACDAGHKTKQVAELFHVSPSWVRRLKQRRRELNRIEPLPPRYGQPPKIKAQHLERLSQMVEQQPDATLQELQRGLGLEVDVSTICRALQKLRLTLKKKSSTPRSNNGPTSRS